MKKKFLKSVIFAVLLCLATTSSVVLFTGCAGANVHWNFYEMDQIQNIYQYKWEDSLDERGRLDGYVASASPKMGHYSDIKDLGKIPTEYNGKPVLQINISSASITDLVVPEGIRYVNLWHCKSLKTVTLPNTIRSLYEENFIECSSLESITIPESVVGIGPGVFAGCTSLKEIKLPKSLTNIYVSAFESSRYGNSALYDDSNNWVDGSFYLDNHLIYVSNDIGTSFSVKEGTTAICMDAFTHGSEYFMKSLESVDLPKSLKYIGENAFNYNYGDGGNSLKEVYFGGSMTDWCAIEFGNQYSNPVYSFYERNKNNLGKEGYETNLYYVDEGKDVLAETVNLPFRATTVNDYAMAGFSCLKHFNMVQNPISYVKYVGKSAFEGCVNLYSLQWGTEIEEIGENVFDGCTKLYNVSIISERYKSLEYTSDDKSTWVQYHCIIDIENKEVIAYTLQDLYIPLFVESFAKANVSSDIPSIRYAGTREQWEAIKNNTIFSYNIQIEYEYKFE